MTPRYHRISDVGAGDRCLDLRPEMAALRSNHPRALALFLEALVDPKLRKQRVLACALTMSVLGWSLMWARALYLVEFIPSWCTIVLFFTGLALIPLGRSGK